MSDREQLAQGIFAALVAAEAPQGDDQLFLKLARHAFKAAEAFEIVRDEQDGGHDVFKVSAVRRT